MPSKADSWHASCVERLLHARGLEHLRARSRGALVTIESGPDDDPIPHARLRRDTVHLWLVEIADHRGRWGPTPIRANLETAIVCLHSDYGWVLTPID